MPPADSPTTRTLSDGDVLLVDTLLRATSRTFALAIPLLEGQLREQVGVAYLLFRIADSIEDAPLPATDRKLELLARLRAGLQDDHPQVDEAFADEGASLWPGDQDIGRLFQAAPRLLRLLGEMPPAAVRDICQSLCCTIGGMAKFLARGAEAGQDIELRSLDELCDYCYYVAGVVGEMLSALFVLDWPQAETLRHELRRLARGFGECLQLTNILKDAERDAAGRRVLLPASVDRDVVFERALESAADGRCYIDLLRHHDFPRHAIRFCQLPLLLAEQTLARVRRDGPGAKLTRDEVLATLRQVRAV